MLFHPFKDVIQNVISASKIRLTWLLSPKCLLIQFLHLKDPHWVCQPFSGPNVRTDVTFSLVPSADILYGGTVCKCLLIHCKYYNNISTLTLTLMILLWKLLSTTMTLPASTGESVPSCLKHTQHYINTISVLPERNTSAHNTANEAC